MANKIILEDCVQAGKANLEKLIETSLDELGNII